MPIDFLNPLSTTPANGKLSISGASKASKTIKAAKPANAAKGLKAPITKAAMIEGSKDVSGIELRLVPPYIKDNHTERVWPFPGFAKLYCLTIVVSDAVNQLAGAIDLKGFPRIGDNEYLPINKTIFYWQTENETDKSPSQVHAFCSIIKSKEGLRDAGKILSDIKDDKQYKDLAGTLSSIAKDATRFNMVADTIMQLAGIVGRYLGSVEDKPIGTVINSYTTLHGDFDNAGITSLLYNTPDVDFKFELIVRNKTAEAAAVKASAKASGPARAMATKKSKKEKEEAVDVDMQPL